MFHISCFSVHRCVALTHFFQEVLGVFWYIAAGYSVLCFNSNHSNHPLFFGTLNQFYLFYPSFKKIINLLIMVLSPLFILFCCVLHFTILVVIILQNVFFFFSVTYTNKVIFLFPLYNDTNVNSAWKIWFLFLLIETHILSFYLIQQCNV